MKTTIYKTICALLGASVLLLAACDPGVAYPEDETMDWTTESWEQMEGELREAKREGRTVEAWTYAEEGEYEDVDDTAPFASCECKCSQQAIDACIKIKDKKGKNLCPPSARPVDVVGSCVQNGSQCNGTCNCRDCYTPLGKKCAQLPAALPGTCEWSFP